MWIATWCAHTEQGWLLPWDALVTVARTRAHARAGAAAMAPEGSGAPSAAVMADASDDSDSDVWGHVTRGAKRVSTNGRSTKSRPSSATSRAAALSRAGSFKVGGLLRAAHGCLPI